MLGAVFLLSTSPWAKLASQEARPTPGTKKRFQPVIGDTSTLKSLIERARPIPKRSELVRHFVSLELAARAYNERKVPGAYIFGSKALRAEFDRINQLRMKGALLSLSMQLKRAQFEMLAWQPVYHWQVLEVAERGKVQGACPQTRNELTGKDWDGFQAVTYINRKSKRVVVAIAGTDPESKADLLNDWIALRGRAAPHFEVACAYLQHVIRQYSARFLGYSFACSGHSLGGGACSVAANRLGRTGITLNPIGTQKLIVGALTFRPSKISNYIDPKDFALDLYKRFNLHPEGRIYWITEKSVDSDLLQTVVQFLRRQPKIVRIWESYLAHSATRSLDRLTKYQRLKRLR